MFLASVLLSAAMLAPPESEASTDSVRRTLDQAVAFEFAFTPLPEVAVALSKRLQVPVVIDETAFMRAGRKTSEEITLELEGVTLESGLNLMCYQARLDYRIDPKKIVLIPEDPKKPAGRRKSALTAATRESVKRIQEALAEETADEADGDSIPELLEFLSDLHNIEIVLDRRGLTERQIDIDPKFQGESKPGTTLQAALQQILKGLDVEPIIENETLFITPKPPTKKPTR